MAHAASYDELIQDLSIQQITPEEHEKLKMEANKKNSEYEMFIENFDESPVYNIWNKSNSIKNIESKGVIAEVFTSYKQSSSATNDKFKNLGEISMNNPGNTIATVSYTQNTTVTSAWSVSPKIEGTASLGTKWLGEIKATFGVTATKSSTTSKGTTVGGSYQVPSKKTATLTLYQKGYKSGGTATYTLYEEPNANPIGTKTYTVEGYAPATNAYNLLVSIK